MTLVLLKLVLTPVLIGGVSLIARRWGPTVGGWMVSLPLTSGPTLFFLDLERGSTFSAAAAEAALAGCVAIIAYVVVYARIAHRAAWPVALGLGAIGWSVAAILVQPMLQWPVLFVFAVVVVVTGLGIRWMPDGSTRTSTTTATRRDILLSMAAGTLVVVFITTTAPLLGSGMSGIFAMVPVIVTVLAVVAHRAGGASHAIVLQRGILTGLGGTASFLAVIASLIDRVGVIVSFGAAFVALVVVQTCILAMLKARSTERPDVAASPADG